MVVSCYFSWIVETRWHQNLYGIMDQIKCSLQPAPAGMVSRCWPKHVPIRNLITCFILYWYVFCCFPATQTDWHAVRFLHDWAWSCCKFVCKPFHMFVCIKWSRMTADSKHLLPICLLFSLQTGGMFSALKSPGVSRKPPAVAWCKKLIKELMQKTSTLVARNQNHEMPFQLCRPFSNFVSLKRTFQTENVWTIRHFCC